MLVYQYFSVYPAEYPRASGGKGGAGCITFVKPLAIWLSVCSVSLFFLTFVARIS